MASLGLSKSRKSSKGFSSHSSSTIAPPRTWSRLSAVVEGQGASVAPSEVKLTVEPLESSSMPDGQGQHQELQHDNQQHVWSLSQVTEGHDEGGEGAGGRGD